MEFAILPVRHRGSRLERLVRRRLTDDGLVDDDGGVLEASLDVADLPAVGRAAKREPTRFHFLPLLFGPLERLGARSVIDVPFQARIRAARAKTLEGSTQNGSGSRSTLIRS